MLIKKYGNRRLYDTESSRYITLEELTQKVRAGAEVRVVDAKSGQDLTQPTLTQIIFEGRGADTLLPTPLLHQLIRLGDDVLADFLGRYVQGALELYLTAKKTTQTLMPFNPFTVLTAPFSQSFGWPQGTNPPPVPPPPRASGSTPAEDAPEPSSPAAEVVQLRRELDEIKRSLAKRRK
jgi:polyhydroxyalkanoate synthesis repressor PhaR